jgi:hypothetical protein
MRMRMMKRRTIRMWRRRRRRRRSRRVGWQRQRHQVGGTFTKPPGSISMKMVQQHQHAQKHCWRQHKYNYFIQHSMGFRPPLAGKGFHD